MRWIQNTKSHHLKSQFKQIYFFKLYLNQYFMYIFLTLSVCLKTDFYKLAQQLLNSYEFIELIQ